MARSAGFDLGFRGLDEEVADRRLPVEGQIPGWLDGTLVRNGPGRFAVDGDRVEHWFDGLAMLQRYAFDDGAVRYTNRFLRTDTYEQAMASGEITGQFATGAGYLRRLWTLLRGVGADNCNVHVAELDGELVALTEVPEFCAVDRQTLDRLGPFAFEDDLKGHLSLAHLVPDPHRGETVGLLTEFGRTSAYRIYTVGDDSRRRQEVATIEADKPAYVHSLAVARNHVVLTEHPFRIDPLSFLTPGGSGFVDHLDWEPARDTLFHVVNRDTGAVVATHRAPANFVFHHVNAYETGSPRDDPHSRDLVVDLVDYPDAGVVDGLRLSDLDEWLRTGSDGRLRRFRLPLDGDARVTGQRLTPRGIELPRITPRLRTRRHRDVYAQGSASSDGNDVVKVDVETGQTTTWGDTGVFVEEPIPVVPPGEPADDDSGVVLVTALNVPEERSDLLVLEAGSLDLLARLPLPHHLPFGFHGRYLPE